MTFEEQLLARLAGARRRDPALADEDGRRRRGWWRRRVPSLVPLWPLIVIARHAGEGRFDAMLAATGVYLLATALVRGGELRQQLRGGADVAAFAALPAPDDWIARRAFRRLAGEAVLVMVPILVAGWRSMPAGSAAWQWAVWAAAGAVGGVLVIALATATAVLPMLGRWAVLGFALHLGVFVTAYFPMSLPTELPAPAWFLIGLAPGGWIAQILRHALGQSDPAGLVWFVPALAVVFTLPALRSRLERGHAVAEIVLVTHGPHYARFEGESLEDLPMDAAEPASEETADEPEDATASTSGERPLTPPATRDQVAVMLEARGPREPGLLDLVIWSVLTERERIATEWLMGRKPRWTGEWRAVLVACAVTAVGSFVVLKDLIPLVALAIPMVLGVALFTWSGFDSRSSGGQVSPLHAPYPIGYGEAARAMLKINAARLVASFPALMVAGGIAGTNTGATPTDACLLALKLWLMILAAQPILVVGAFMGGANDALGWRTLLAAPFIVTGAIAWLVSGVAWLLESGLGDWGSFAIFTAVPLVALAVYGWLYDRGHVDLLRTPR